jgi:hypothetical protein
MLFGLVCPNVLPQTTFDILFKIIHFICLIFTFVEPLVGPTGSLLYQVLVISLVEGHSVDVADILTVY